MGVGCARCSPAILVLALRERVGARSSTMVFHSPQVAHRPTQRGLAEPHDLHEKMVFSLLDALLMRSVLGRTKTVLRGSLGMARGTILPSVPRAMLWTLAMATLFSVVHPPTIEAQARELGSPTGQPSGARAAPEAAPAPPEAAPAPPPTSYEGVDVPPPPGSEPPGIRYPGQERPRPRVMTTDAGVRIPSGIATRLRALDSDFQVLAARGGGSLVDGILGILTGGLAVTLGILLLDEPSSAGGLNMSPYLFTYGAASVARGILSLVLMTNPSGSAIAYSHMPMTNMHEVRARLEYGERELASLADRSRLSRILDGSLNVAVGLAIIPIYLGPNNFEIVNTFDWFVLIGAGISAISGVITLLSSTEAERRWSAYEELRDRLAARGEDTREAGESQPSSSRGPRIAPMATGYQGGGILGVEGSF